MPLHRRRDRCGVEVNRLDIRAVFPFTFQERFKSGSLVELRARRMTGSSLASISLVHQMVIFLNCRLVAGGGIGEEEDNGTSTGTGWNNDFPCEAPPSRHSLRRRHVVDPRSCNTSCSPAYRCRSQIVVLKVGYNVHFLPACQVSRVLHHATQSQPSTRHQSSGLRLRTSRCPTTSAATHARSLLD